MNHNKVPISHWWQSCVRSPLVGSDTFLRMRWDKVLNNWVQRDSLSILHWKYNYFARRLIIYSENLITMYAIKSESNIHHCVAPFPTSNSAYVMFASNSSESLIDLARLINPQYSQNVAVSCLYWMNDRWIFNVYSMYIQSFYIVYIVLYAYVVFINIKAQINAQ